MPVLKQRMVLPGFRNEVVLEVVPFLEPTGQFRSSIARPVLRLGYGCTCSLIARPVLRFGHI
eukprot:157564-Rhodomonas_salina.1